MSYHTLNSFLIYLGEAAFRRRKEELVGDHIKHSKKTLISNMVSQNHETIISAINWLKSD